MSIRKKSYWYHININFSHPNRRVLKPTFLTKSEHPTIFLKNLVKKTFEKTLGDSFSWANDFYN